MEKNYDQIIVRYLTDQLSVQEEAMLFAWIAESSEHENHYNEFVKVWGISSSLDRHYIPDTQRAWNTFAQHIQQEEKQQPLKMSVFRSTGFYQIAASIVMVLGLSYLAIINMGSVKKEIIRQTAENRDVFYLPDSSMVWLNQHSSLTYAPSFDGKERIVYLTGQAFFDVKKKPEQPFIIYASGTTTKVLGTSFELKAYQEEDVQLTVVSGKVSFTAQNQTILLLPKDKGVFHRKDHSLALQPHQETAEKELEMAWLKEDSFRGNSIYEAERNHPVRYTHHTFQWHSNFINQTVIEGTISSSAKVCAYDTLQMKATYVSKKNKVLDYPFTIVTSLAPGATISYKKKLPDWFKDTKEVRIVIEK